MWKLNEFIVIYTLGHLEVECICKGRNKQIFHLNFIKLYFKTELPDYSINRILLVFSMFNKQLFYFLNATITIIQKEQSNKKSGS